MSDLISRQAAIDALRVAYWDDNIQSAKDDPCIVDAMTDWAIRQVKALPSAQPETHEERTKTHACVCISREAAQKLICEDGTRLEKDGVYELTMCAVKQWAVDLLDELPSVEPEQKSRECASCKHANNGGECAYTEECHKCMWESQYERQVEPERKTGKWLLKIEDWNRWTCSECGFSKRTDIHVSLGYKFCPNCGAKMEGADG